MRSVALLLPLALLAGCSGPIGDHGWSSHPGNCAAGSLHAEWVEPGLHAALAEHPRAERIVPPGPRLSGTLFDAWGAVGLVEVARVSPAGGRGDVASISQTTWNGDGPLQLAVSLESRHDAEGAVALARELLDGLGVAREEQEPMLERLREAFQPAPPGVANSIGAVPLTAPIEWDALPSRIFGDAQPELKAFSDRRMLERDGWRLIVTVETMRLEDGDGLVLDVAKDDRVVATVQLDAPSEDAAGRERVNATLVAAGFGNASYEDYEGRVVVC